MRVVNSVIAGILLAGLCIASADAAQEACPSAETIKLKNCGPSPDMPAGWNECNYEAATSSGITWEGTDAAAWEENEKIQLKFIQAETRKSDKGEVSQVFCDYAIHKADDSDTKDGLRLSLKNPTPITLSDTWNASAAKDPVLCHSQDPSACTFTIAPP